MLRNYIGAAMIVLLLFAGLSAVDEPVEEVIEYEGTVMQISSIWFLKTADNMFGLELVNLVNEVGIAPELAAGDTVKVKGTMQSAVLQVKELQKAEQLYIFKIVEEQKIDNKGYQVTSNRCIGCQLCVKNCPTGAISMQKGKAVIDVAKCIQCGICRNGNGQGWNGCPVGAIDNK